MGYATGRECSICPSWDLIQNGDHEFVGPTGHQLKPYSDLEPVRCQPGKSELRCAAVLLKILTVCSHWSSLPAVIIHVTVYARLLGKGRSFKRCNGGESQSTCNFPRPGPARVKNVSHHKLELTKDHSKLCQIQQSNKDHMPARNKAEHYGLSPWHAHPHP